MAGFVAQAVTGLGFWLLAARLYDSDTVGLATGLFASLQFVNYATAMGLQEMLSRYPDDGRDHSSALFTASVVITVTTSAVGAAVYLGVVKSGATDSLLSVGTVMGGLLFFVLSAGAAIALLVDVRLMSARRWSLVFARLLATGALRIPFLWVPAPVDDALWLFIVMAAPISLSGWFGLTVLPGLTRLRYSLTRAPTVVAAARFAGINYVSHLAVLAPQFVLPVIVFLEVNPTDNANFYLAWTVASVAFILPVTIGRVLLVEGSRVDNDDVSYARPALALAGGLMLIGFLAALPLETLVVELFGEEYRDVARLLPILMAGGLPWAFTSIALARARIRHDHLSIVVMPVALAGAIVGLGLILVPSNGIDGAANAWFFGNLVAAGLAGVLVWHSRRTPLPSEA